MLCVDASSNGVEGSLRMNSRNSENDDSDNNLIRSCVCSSDVGESVMAQVDSGYNP